MSSTIITRVEKVDFTDPELALNSTESCSSSDDLLLTKCGVVFLQHGRQYELFIFICTLCDERFDRLETFTKHIQDAHLIEESTEMVEADMNEVKDHEDDHKDFNEDMNEEQYQEDELQCAWKEEDFKEINEEQYQEDELQCARKMEDLKEEEQYFQDYETIAQLKMELLPEANDDDKFASTMPKNATITADSPVTVFEHSEKNKKLFDEELSCNVCGKVFKRAKELRQHICFSWEHDDIIKLFQCSQCAKCFKRKSNLKIHEIIHQAIKPYACDQCSATFANKQNLVVHMRRHTGEKPFECRYCKKAFVSSTERNSHERLHTGTRPYVCEECGKTYTTSSHLLEHRKRHTNERLHHCGDCEKSFRTNSHLRAHHMVVHANLPRSHRCTHCAACFKTVQALQQHVKIHAEVKRYKCRLCGKKFAQHPGLYAHMKTH